MIVFRTHKDIVCFSTRNEAAERSKKEPKISPLLAELQLVSQYFFPLHKILCIFPETQSPFFYVYVSLFGKFEGFGDTPDSTKKWGESIVLLARFCRVIFLRK